MKSFCLATAILFSPLIGVKTDEVVKLNGPYDENADGAALVEHALKKAGEEGKRVLLVFGANWCSDCRAMDALFKVDKSIAALLRTRYVVEKIDVGGGAEQPKNLALIKRFEVAVETGIPVLVVLDARGTPLNNTKKERLADTDHQEPAKVLAFLKKWAP